MDHSSDDTAPGVSACPRCGTPFGCSAAQPGCSCWCASVTLTDSRLTDLAHRYTGCLCQVCLDELAATAG